MAQTLPCGGDSPAAVEGDSIPALFLQRVRRSGGETAIWIKVDGVYQPRNWNAVGRDVLQMAALLRQQGLSEGDRLAQVAENCYRWIVIDLAVQLLGAVHVALQPTLSGRQIAEQLADCRPRALIVAGAEQLAKLAGHRETLAQIEAVWTHEHLERAVPGGIDCTPLASLPQADLERQTADLAATAERNAAAERLATIIYTSGSTGRPRGAMLSSGNLAFNARACVAAFAEQPEDVRLNFLPLSHVFARTCDLYTWIVRGSVLALAESRETLLDDLQQTRPTLLNGVPYFFDKVRRGLIQRQAADRPGALRQALGGAIRFCSSGGAPLADETVAYYESQQVTLVQGYGLTETSPVISLSTEQANRRGAVGKVLPGVELRTGEDGEILTRGPHVMSGYWNDAEATAEALQDGWFHTGDLGRLDDDGFLWITGRKKEMIVTAGGKTIAPAAIESRLTLDPLIEQACVVGDRQRCLAALIVPNPTALRAAIREMRLWVFSRRGALRHRRVQALYRETIVRCLADMASHEQVRRFHLLDRGFTLENGELTAKLSLRRGVIEEHLAREIAALFDDG